MPIYEYQCSECGHVFELLRSMSLSDSDASCPTCGGSAEKKLSVFACSVKGSTSSSGASCPAMSPGGT